MGGQVELPQQRLPGFGLQRCKAKLPLAVAREDELHDAIAEVAHAIEEKDLTVATHGAGYFAAPLQGLHIGRCSLPPAAFQASPSGFLAPAPFRYG